MHQKKVMEIDERCLITQLLKDKNNQRYFSSIQAELPKPKRWRSKLPTQVQPPLRKEKQTRDENISSKPKMLTTWSCGGMGSEWTQRIHEN